MFRLMKTPVVTWPVVIAIPTDGGTVTEVRCSARFELLTSTEFNEQVKAGDVALLNRSVKDWEGVGDEAGQPLPFTPENTAALWDIPFVRKAFVNAYLEASAGAPAKN